MNSFCKSKINFTANSPFVIIFKYPPVSSHLHLCIVNSTLWFDGQAKTAAEFYCSIFRDLEISSENPTVVTQELNGNQFMGLNGGPGFNFNKAVSFVIECETQEDIDHYRNKLISSGGAESQCGWCKDQFGVSRQGVPKL